MRKASVSPSSNTLAKAPEGAVAKRVLARLNFELLQLFVLIAKLGTISAAADEIGLASSHATRKLADLERLLDIRLFHRTTRRLTLTEAGELALGWAMEALGGYEAFSNDRMMLAGKPTGIAQILANQYCAEHLLPPVLEQFRVAYPELGIAITVSDDLSLLEQGKYDFAIHTGYLPDSDYVAKQIRPFDRILCATPTYLAQRGVPRQPKDLVEHDCLVHTVNEPKYWFFQKDGELVCQPITATFESDSHSVLLALAKHSLGIVRFSRTMLSQDLEAGTLIQVMPEYQCAYFNRELPGLWLVYPNRKVLYRTRLLMDFLIQRLQVV